VVDPRRIADFCQTHGVREMALFGSVLRDDFGPESDIDVLVEFFPKTRMSLFRLVDMQDELTRIFGRQVDLVTKPALHPYIRDSVLRDREVVYVATE
jgi:predicted nucleotidyltransferase